MKSFFAEIKTQRGGKMPKTKKIKSLIPAFIATIIIAAVFFIPGSAEAAKGDVPNWDSLRAVFTARATGWNMTPAIEKDLIYSLLAYSVVFKNWQVSKDTGRGYNIGSVLVNPSGTVIYWATNCVNVTGNMTQHGEVRLMNCYLASTKKKDLKNHIIYTTLEPCAQCAGMMKLTSVYRTVYGQTDPGYGKAHERLDLNSYVWNPDSGYTPYPRHVISDTLAAFERWYLDEIYQLYLDTCMDSSITKFLTSKGAYDAYAYYQKEFLNYQVKYQENYMTWKQARIYYDSVPDHYVQLCPPE